MITGNPRLRQVRKTQIMPFRDFTAISEDVLEKIVRHLFYGTFCLLRTESLTSRQPTLPTSKRNPLVVIADSSEYRAAEPAEG